MSDNPSASGIPHQNAVSQIEEQSVEISREFESCLDDIRQAAVRCGKRSEHESLRLSVADSTWLFGWVDRDDCYLRVDEGDGWVPVYEGEIVVPVERLSRLVSHLDKLDEAFNEWAEMPSVAQQTVGGKDGFIDTCSLVSSPDSISDGKLFNALQESVTTLYESVLPERERGFEGIRDAIESEADAYLSHVLVANTSGWREISKWFSTCPICGQRDTDAEVIQDSKSIVVTTERCSCQDGTSPMQWEIRRKSFDPTEFEVIRMFSEAEDEPHLSSVTDSQTHHFGVSDAQDSISFLLGARYGITENAFIERVTGFRNHLEWRIEGKAEYYFNQIDQWAREKASSEVSDTVEARLQEDPLLDEMSLLMNDDPLEAPTISGNKLTTEELKELQKAVGITETDVRDTYNRWNEDSDSYYSYSRLTARARKSIVFSKINEQYVNKFNDLVDQYVGDTSINIMKEHVRDSVFDEFYNKGSSEYTKQLDETVEMSAFPVVQSSRDSFVVPSGSDSWIAIRQRDRRSTIGPLPAGRYRIYTATDETPVEEFLYDRSWEYSQSRSPRSPRKPESDRIRYPHLNNSIW